MCADEETGYRATQSGAEARSTDDREGACERDLGMSRNAIRSLMLLTPPCLAAWWLAGLTGLWMVQAVL